MKTLSINIVLRVVLWGFNWYTASINISYNLWKTHTVTRLINPFPNFLCWLWKTYVPRKKELYNGIAYLNNYLAYGGLPNCKKVCNRTVSCGIRKPIQNNRKSLESRDCFAKVYVPL